MMTRKRVHDAVLVEMLTSGDTDKMLAAVRCALDRMSPTEREEWRTELLADIGANPAAREALAKVMAMSPEEREKALLAALPTRPA
jgi:hypothetical protein